jgi:hypothetical protein
MRTVRKRDGSRPVAMMKKGGKAKKKVKNAKLAAKGAPTAANFRRAAQTARKK